MARSYLVRRWFGDGSAYKGPERAIYGAERSVMRSYWPLQGRLSSMSADCDWVELAVQVKARRTALRLPQDLVPHGGPSDLTVRRIENGGPGPYRPKTLTQLERALRWPDGLADRILARTQTDADLAAVASSTPMPEPSEHWRAVVEHAAVVDSIGLGSPSDLELAASLMTRLAARRDPSPAVRATLAALAPLMHELVQQAE